MPAVKRFISNLVYFHHERVNRHWSTIGKCCCLKAALVAVPQSVMSQLVFPIKLSSEDACWDPRTRSSSSSSSRGLVACVLQFWCTTQYSTFSQELQHSQTQNERALYWGHLGSTLLSRGSKVTSFAPYSTSSGSTAAIFYSPDRSFDGGGGGGPWPDAEEDICRRRQKVRICHNK